MNVLVSYFSRAGENSVDGKIEIIEKGFTEIVAEKIAKYTNGSLYKIEPVEPYPYNYEECVKRAREEVLTPFVKKLESLDNYDVVFVGFPNWYRSYPRVVASFLKEYNFIGKSVIPFCTNEEGMLGIGDLELRSAVKGAIIKTGFACKGKEADNCDEALKAWLAKVL